MATVPILGAPLATQSPAPVYQTDNVPAAAFGSVNAAATEAVGKGLDAVGTAGLKIATKMQQEDIERQTKQADVALSDRLRTIAYGDGTAANPGYLSQQGDAAVNGIGGAQAEAQKAAADIVASIPSQRARDLYTSVAQSRVSHAMAQFDSHVSTQRQVANANASAARIDTATNDAAASWNDPTILAQSLSIVRNEATALAQIHGYAADSPEAQKAVSAATAGVYKNVILNASQVDPAYAQKLFVDHMSEIPGDAQAGIQRELQTAAHMAQAQQEHQMLMAEHAQTQAANAAQDRYVSAIISGGTVDLKQVASDPALAGKANLKLMIANMVKAADKGDPLSRVSQQTVTDLFPRIYLPDGDPNKITDNTALNQEFIAGNLSRTDLDWLRKQVADAQTPDGSRLGKTRQDFLTGVKGQITKSNPLMGSLDATGDANYYNFTQYVAKALSDARANGQDPYELLRPGSPKFLGSPAALAPFQKTLQQSLDFMSEHMTRTTGGEAVAAPSYSSLGDLQAAVKAGKVTRADAVKIAHDKGWIAQ